MQCKKGGQKAAFFVRAGMRARAELGAICVQQGLLIAQAGRQNAADASGCTGGADRQQGIRLVSRLPFHGL